MEKSGGEGNDPLYRIPTLRLFREYQLESEEPIEDLTDLEREHILVKQENMIFALAQKGVIKPEVGKLCLANEFGWSERTKPKEDGPIDYVCFDMNGLLTDPAENHDGESLENEAVKDLKIGG